MEPPMDWHKELNQGEDTVPEQIKSVIGAGTGLVVGGVTGAGFAEQPK